MRYGEPLHLLNPAGRIHFSYFGREHGAPSIELTSERLLFAEGILSDRAGRDDLDLAIGRWKNSVSASYLHDQLIELRVVLEALYAGQGPGELRYRVALHGAWHLRRKEYFGLFRELYDDASKLIHAGRPQANSELIGKARDACRDAIVKRLAEAEGADYTQEILDTLLPETAGRESAER